MYSTGPHYYRECWDCVKVLPRRALDTLNTLLTESIESYRSIRLVLPSRVIDVAGQDLSMLRSGFSSECSIFVYLHLLRMIQNISISKWWYSRSRCWYREHREFFMLSRRALDTFDALESLPDKSPCIVWWKRGQGYRVVSRICGEHVTLSSSCIAYTIRIKRRIGRCLILSKRVIQFGEFSSHRGNTLR